MSSDLWLLRSMTTRGVITPHKSYDELLDRFIPKATPIVADNVADFVANRGSFALMEDCPNLAPPFDHFWIEYTDKRRKNVSLRVGVLFHGMELDPESPREAMMHWFEGYGDDDPICDALGRIKDDPRWILFGYVFLKFPNNDLVVGPTLTFDAVLDKQGACILHDNDRAVVITSLPKFEHWDYANFDLESARKSMFHDMAPALVTISFMHCKNVIISDNIPSRQQRRDAQRRGEAITKYKTLQIEPMKRVLETEGGLSRNGLKKALHICRGHFSHYSEDKPLFGKYAGTFWIPAHVRGTTESGQVIKDYNVNAPREVAA